MTDRPLGIFRSAFQNRINLLTIKCSDILHIISVFQPSFNFEAGDASIHQFFKVIVVIQIFQTKQVLPFDKNPFVGYLPPFFGVGGGHQIPRQSTRLRTSPSIGTPIADIMTQITLTAVTHA